jgi:hypothetical protein
MTGKKNGLWAHLQDGGMSKTAIRRKDPAHLISSAEKEAMKKVADTYGNGEFADTTMGKAKTTSSLVSNFYKNSPIGMESLRGVAGDVNGALLDGEALVDLVSFKRFYDVRWAEAQYRVYTAMWANHSTVIMHLFKAIANTPVLVKDKPSGGLHLLSSTEDILRVKLAWKQHLDAGAKAQTGHIKRIQDGCSPADRVCVVGYDDETETELPWSAILMLVDCAWLQQAAAAEDKSGKYKLVRTLVKALDYSYFCVVATMADITSELKIASKLFQTRDLTAAQVGAGSAALQRTFGNEAWVGKRTREVNEERDAQAEANPPGMQIVDKACLIHDASQDTQRGYEIATYRSALVGAVRSRLPPLEIGGVEEAMGVVGDLSCAPWGSQGDIDDWGNAEIDKIIECYPALWDSQSARSSCAEQWREMKRQLDQPGLAWLRAKPTKVVFEYFLTNKSSTLASVNVLFVLVLSVFWGSVECERAYSLIARFKTKMQSTMSASGTLQQQVIVHSYLAGLPPSEWPLLEIAQHFFDKKNRSPTMVTGTPITEAKAQVGTGT